jgi:hypothetical protein
MILEQRCRFRNAQPRQTSNEDQSSSLFTTPHPQLVSNFADPVLEILAPSWAAPQVICIRPNEDFIPE